MNRRSLTAVCLMAVSGGLLTMFLTIWPEAAVAWEPNKATLLGEIIASCSFMAFGFYSMMREARNED